MSSYTYTYVVGCGTACMRVYITHASKLLRAMTLELYSYMYE